MINYIHDHENQEILAIAPDLRIKKILEYHYDHGIVLYRGTNGNIYRIQRRELCWPLFQFRVQIDTATDHNDRPVAAIRASEDPPILQVRK